MEESFSVIISLRYISLKLESCKLLQDLRFRLSFPKQEVYMKIVKKLIVAIAAAALTISTFTGFTAKAAENTGSLTVNVRNADETLSGVDTAVYKVADFTGSTGMKLAKAFAGIGIRIDDYGTWDSEKSKSNAAAFFAYATAKNISATASGVTDTSGQYKADNLSIGMYLVKCKDYSVVSGKTTKTYTFTPYLISIPTTESGKLVYDVVSENSKWSSSEETKPDTPPTTPENPTTPAAVTVTYQVKKHWDDGNYSERPTAITVTLYKDNSVYDTQVLNEANSWTYIWTGLEPGYVYSCFETVPEGYTMTQESAATTTGTILDITNKKTIEIPPSDTPGGPTDTPTTPTTPTPPEEIEVPPSDTPGTPTDIPTTPEITVPETPIPAGPLPQTGLLWWPVPILAFAGLMLLVLGISFKARDSYD